MEFLSSPKTLRRRADLMRKKTGIEIERNENKIGCLTGIEIEVGSLTGIKIEVNARN